MNDHVQMCISCRYFASSNPQMEANVSGLCHRFPRVEHVTIGHWCGEYRQVNQAPGGEKLPARQPDYHT